MSARATHVVVGAGLAGAKAVETLRSEGFEGRIVLVGSEDARPYERPPLSKEYLRGEIEREKTYVHPEGFYREQEIEFRSAATAAALELAPKEVLLADGERVAYDRLLLATGSEPRRLRVPGSELEGVHYLRTVRDADLLHERLERASSIVVIGAGWIGLEVAASARQLRREVTVISPEAVPFERIFGPEVGTIFRDVHTAHDTRMLLGTGVSAIEGSGEAERVVTKDGRTIDCDLVVVGIGALPRIGLADDAGLSVADGILVDANLCTSDPDVFAAGDVAAVDHPLYEGRVRVEHWANALNQGPAAARNMLGRSETYDRPPYFFSDQYELGMEYRGFARTWDRVVFRGAPESHEFIAFWLVEDRVVAAMNLNVWDGTDAIEKLVRERASVTDAALADPDIPLERLAVPRPSEGVR